MHGNRGCKVCVCIVHVHLVCAGGNGGHGGGVWGVSVYVFCGHAGVYCNTLHHPTLCCFLHTGKPPPESTAPATHAPCLYFSPRRSPAPATPGSLAAQGSARGMGATASVGAAALWKGAPGAPLDAGVMSDMQRVLDTHAPRVRVLGGGRFSQQQVGGMGVFSGGWGFILG